MIAGEDHVRLLDAYRSVEGCRDLVGGGVLVVDHNVVEVVADEASPGVDLVHCHLDAVLHLLAVGSDHASDREDSDYFDAPAGACAGAC